MGQSNPIQPDQLTYTKSRPDPLPKPTYPTILPPMVFNHYIFLVCRSYIYRVRIIKDNTWIPWSTLEWWTATGDPGYTTLCEFGTLSTPCCHCPDCLSQIWKYTFLVLVFFLHAMILHIYDQLQNYTLQNHVTWLNIYNGWRQIYNFITMNNITPSVPSHEP